MPNHVYCVLKFIYHDDKWEMIDSIAKRIKGRGTPIDFNKIIPQPKGIKDMRKYVLSDSERSWCIENWGTKWNAYEAKVVGKEEWNYLIRFQTAWNIPEPVIMKICELFPSVRIKFIAADDGGFFAYHIEKDENAEPVIKCWDSETEEMSSARTAIFEALNNKY